jgi:ABC-type oligopeptide transport system, periplasmic component
MLAALALGLAAVGASAEKVVSLPYGDNIPSFVPYYWQSQHMLAQGTIFEGLFGYAPDPTGLGGVKVVPKIATDGAPSADGMTYTVHLRKDKKWSNGDPITAKDFEWTYKYMCDPSIPDVPLWANHLQYVKNGWSCKAGGVPLDQLGVKATDDYTLVFTLAMPRFDFDAWLCVAGSMPLHRATVEKWGPNEWWKPEHFVGNGPYVPQSWTPQKEAVLVKNKNFVGKVGNVDKIVLKNYAAGVSQVQAYQAGEIDLAWISNVADYAYATKNAALKKDYKETPNDLMIGAYELTKGFNKVFDDIRVRQAFAYGTDRDTLANTVLAGRAVPTGAFWTSDSTIGKQLKGFTFDLPKAKKLLADAGYPNGKGLPALKFYTDNQNQTVAEALVDQWKKNLGVDVQIENVESGVYGTKYVWASWTPDAEPGFARVNGPMNSFEAGALDKNGVHTTLFYGYPADVRQKDYDFDKLKTDYLTKEGGTKDADWTQLLADRDRLWAATKKIIAGEPNKAWLQDLDRKPTYDQQFADLYNKYKAATADKDKTDAWRMAGRLNCDQEKTVLEYNGMYDWNKQARRIRYDYLNMTFDKAIQAVPKFIQIVQDQAYIVPLFMDKVQYVQRQNITGLMVYKFSWGPFVFNLGELNVK